MIYAQLPYGIIWNMEKPIKTSDMTLNVSSQIKIII
jgi:hypothetical protein